MAKKGENMYKVTVLQITSERIDPDIYAKKTGVIFEPGTTWLTETLVSELGGAAIWMKTPSGNWTAAKYPVNNDPTNIKIYLEIVEIPSEPSPNGQYNPDDKLIHEVDGVIVAEYHRWLL